jgi:hypothetical protein
MNEALIQMFRIQGEACARLGSPFNGGLCLQAAEAIAAGDDLAGLFAPWACASSRKLFEDAVPIRFLGALHDLVLSGAAPALAQVYPRADHPVDAQQAWRAARALLEAERETLAQFMTHEPQTNEVRRSACLVGGFLTVAQRWALPLRTFELGASAGLNLHWDGFHYEIGGALWGPRTSPVQIDTSWDGAPPPVDADCTVIERAACDRRPVRLDDPLQRRRLLAYVWPDQFERFARIEAAIDLALAKGVNVETADAPVWTAARAAPRSGVTTVVYHSVFWQYMPAESQTALQSALAAHGAAATETAPFAWLRMEPPPGNLALMDLRLTMWPSGEERVLAEVHPHGAAVKWLAP